MKEKTCQLDELCWLVLRSLVSQRHVLLKEERKEKSCWLCACYLLFDLKRLPHKLRFINDQIVEDEAIYNP